MKFLNNKNYFKLIRLILVISLSILIYDKYQHYTALQYYKETHSSVELLKLVERNHDGNIVPPQELYDLYYNRYKEFNDEEFIIGYNQAYLNCMAHEKVCDLKKDADIRLGYSRQACIKNKVQYCIDR